MQMSLRPSANSPYVRHWCTITNGFKLAGWFYLIFYNILFVLPLLIVMISAAYGLKWTKLSKLMQNNLTLTKLLLALVLFALAAFIIIVK